MKFDKEGFWLLTINTVRVAIFAVLACVLRKWWIILLSVMFLAVRKKDPDACAHCRFEKEIKDIIATNDVLRNTNNALMGLHYCKPENEEKKGEGRCSKK